MGTRKRANSTYDDINQQMLPTQWSETGTAKILIEFEAFVDGELDWAVEPDFDLVGTGLECAQDMISGGEKLKREARMSVRWTR